MSDHRAVTTPPDYPDNPFDDAAPDVPDEDVDAEVAAWEAKNDA